jgi:hypothetical protein
VHSRHVRAIRERTKKLLIAFHFQFSPAAAWKCDECRASGLMKIRNCAWLPAETERSKRIVWLRRSVRSTQCPKSIISPLSHSFVETFNSLRQLRGGLTLEVDAKTADALSVLEQEWEEERRHVEIEKNGH